MRKFLSFTAVASLIMGFSLLWNTSALPETQVDEHEQQLKNNSHDEDPFKYGFFFPINIPLPAAPAGTTCTPDQATCCMAICTNLDDTCESPTASPMVGSPGMPCLTAAGVASPNLFSCYDGTCPACSTFTCTPANKLAFACPTDTTLAKVCPF